MTAEPDRVPAGTARIRVVWLPGDDRLRGTCHCGSEVVAEGPVEVWTWLLAHPDGHHGADRAHPGALVGAAGVPR